jgi:hypothetical protein
LKPERWGSPLVQEKYRAEQAVTRDIHKIIIIIIIIIMSELILTYLARQYTKVSTLRSTVLLADIQKIHAPSQFALSALSVCFQCEW